MARLTDKDVIAMYRYDAARRILYDDGPHSLSDFRDRCDNDVQAATLVQLRRHGQAEQTWDETSDRKVWQLTEKGRHAEHNARQSKVDRAEARARSEQKQRERQEENDRIADLEVANRIADWLEAEHGLLVHKSVVGQIREGTWRTPNL